MEQTSAWKSGMALAVTVAIAYAICTLIFAAFPKLALMFMNSLFHGLDFRRLQSEGGNFDMAGFGLTTIVLFGYSFVIGAVYAAVRSRLVH